jgi:hypothetical protein
LREGLRDHLVGVKQSKLVMTKDILCTLASTSEVGRGRVVARLLGVDRRNIGWARSSKLNSRCKTGCIMAILVVENLQQHNH